MHGSTRAVALAMLAGFLAAPLWTEPAAPVAGEHATLGPTACAQCHADQNRWWFDDNHFESASRLLDPEPRAREIARRYGLSAAEMVRGDQVCMRCHGTSVTGRETQTVADGVSCESCHGAAELWLEPHRAHSRSGGGDRPGHARALDQGLRDLGSLEAMTRTCTDCHYITDQRLIHTTHTTGLAFPYADRMERVRHWQRELRPIEELEAAFDRAVEERGFRRAPVRAVLVPPRGSETRSARRRIPKNRPALPLPAAAPTAPSRSLEPFGGCESQSIEQCLMNLRDRLRTLAERARDLFEASNG